ncbi:unnamed protein product [Paramecium sonneborni]|uniref:Adiponectin receptor n=1 Tax=Paramecium sonneborni TaxID=65129 RepID=A0A8S1PCW6_9CILI|nr:unnamed protein product [Paramecium sonneborni]
MEVISNKTKHYIGTIQQAAKHYTVDNVYIFSGYRINYFTPWLILKSLFQKHNELINVWTHVIGSFLTFLLIIYIVSYHYDHKQRIEQDIDQIFSFNQTLNSNSISNENFQADQQKYEEIFNKIDHFQNSMLTSETYREIVHLMKITVEILNFEEVAEYAIIFQNKFNLFKDKIIQEIDSEQFDWVEIYKHDYSHTSILKQEQFLRNNNDPYHVSRWPIVVFLVSGLMCMSGSALFHLFYQMSEAANKYLMRVDYGGISLLILGSCFPPFYYGFYCDTFLRYFYLVTVGSACLAAYIVSIFDFIHTEKWRKIKGLMYGSLGLFAGVPAVHLYLREFYREEISDYLPFKHSFLFYILMGSSYLFGLALYTLRIPERFLPGKFDIFGHSHQWWHCFVFLGVFFHYFGSIYNMGDRKFTFCLI